MLARRVMRARVPRALVRAFAFASLALAAAHSAARAQDVECDAGEKEVRSLSFVGNSTFSDDVLSARVLVTPSSLIRRYLRIVGTKRCYPTDGLKPDVARLKQFYRNNGFYSAQIDTIVKPQGANAVAVTFRIDESAPIRVDSLSITGLDSVPDSAAITRDLHLEVGNRFGLVPMVADEDTIVSRLRNVGYPRAEVFPASRTDTVHLHAEVELDVQPGPRARVGQIAVTRAGVDRRPPEIDSAVVLRLLGFRPGDWYSARDIANAQRNLYQLGAYRHVGITLDTAWQHGDSLADLDVNLVEDYIRRVDLEEGWANLDCFRVNGQYTDNNFLKQARHLELNGRLSKIGFGAPTGDIPGLSNLCRRHQLEKDSISSSKLNYYAGATLRQPQLFGSAWVPAYSAYTERRGEYLAYLRTTTIGLDASATRDVSLLTPLRFGYTFEYGRTQAQPAVLCAAFSRCNKPDQDAIQVARPLAVASASLSRSRTDDVLNPTRGWALAGEVRTAQSVIGSDASLRFLKGTGDVMWYFPLPSRAVFAFRLRAGWIGGYSQVPPPQERLYAGGETSVRGYQKNLLGSVVYLLDSTQTALEQFGGDTVAFVAKGDARQTRTIPVGGNSLVVANVEIRLRDPFFPDLLQYVLFTDGGQVWTRQNGTHNLEFGKFAITPGVGVKYFSPVGPIQVNAGYNPYPSPKGPAYFVVTPNASNQQPLICVNGPDVADPVKVLQTPGGLVPLGTECPSSFAPAQTPSKNSFVRLFDRIVWTISIGTGF
ncbi:MAG TPA: BamA/TamA family outer membrane protein [Gemmatimonadaceae bacterium]|nr:BamA/TamA family outer membrane protein [Gemmatimonadaceae bacterium]